MRPDKGQISGKQLMFSVACYIQPAGLLTSFLVGVLKQDSCLGVLGGFALCLPLLALYRSLLLRFPGRDLIGMLLAVFGPVAGRILGAAYVWFFFTLAALNLTDLGMFTKMTLLEETPVQVLLVMAVLVSAMAVRGGVKLVTRLSTLFVVTTFLLMALSISLVLNQVHAEYFLPALTKAPIKYVQGIHIGFAIPFGETVVFLMLGGSLRPDRRELGRGLFGGLFMGAVTILIVVARDIAVLGNTIDLFALPHLVALRVVDLGPALSRMEILFAILYVMLLFFRSSFLYYVSVLAAARLLGAKQFRHLVLAAGALIIAYGLTLFPSSVEHTAVSQQTIPILWTFFEVVLPLLLSVLARVRGLPRTAVPAPEAAAPAGGEGA